MRRLMAGAMVLASVSLWLAGAQQAQATNFTCNDFTGNGMTGDVSGNVTVPADGQCNTNGFDVGGNITVGNRAKLFVESGTDIKGTVTAYGPKQLNLADGSTLAGSLNINGPSDGAFGGFACGVTIGGSVNLQSLTAGRWVIGDSGDSGEGYDFSSTSPELNCDTSSTIHGSVNLISNKGVQTLEVSGNTITGGVTINSNTVVNEAIEVEGNKLGGSLGCSGNTWTGGSPAINNGGEPNTAPSKTGQCKGF